MGGQRFSEEHDGVRKANLLREEGSGRERGQQVQQGQAGAIPLG
jgi:hypothetical protein